MKLTLHYRPHSCALAPYIALTEAAAPFEVEVLQVFGERHRQIPPEFLRTNPKGKVPVLVIDGEPLTENVAIQQWIARQFPAARLLPSNGLDEFRAIALLAWIASAIHPALSPNSVPERYCDFPGSADSVKRCAKAALAGQIALAEDLLAGRDFFFDHFTTVDGYFFWAFRRTRSVGIDPQRYPHCQSHFARMLTRPSVQKLLALEASVLEQRRQDAILIGAAPRPALVADPPAAPLQQGR